MGKCLPQDKELACVHHDIISVKLFNLEKGGWKREKKAYRGTKEYYKQTEQL